MTVRPIPNAAERLSRHQVRRGLSPTDRRSGKRGTHGKSAARCATEKSPRNKHELQVPCVAHFFDALSLRYLSAYVARREAPAVTPRGATDTKGLRFSARHPLRFALK